MSNIAVSSEENEMSTAVVRPGVKYGEAMLMPYHLYNNVTIKL